MCHRLVGLVLLMQWSHAQTLLASDAVQNPKHLPALLWPGNSSCSMNVTLCAEPVMTSELDVVCRTSLEELVLDDAGGLRVNRIENLVRESQQSMAYDPAAMWCALVLFVNLLPHHLRAMQCCLSARASWMLAEVIAAPSTSSQRCCPCLSTSCLQSADCGGGCRTLAEWVLSDAGAQVRGPVIREFVRLLDVAVAGVAAALSITSPSACACAYSCGHAPCSQAEDGTCLCAPCVT